MFELATEQRVLLPSCSWETYERILADHLDLKVPHFTYDKGVLEILSPSPEHERATRVIEALVMLICLELGLEVQALGSATQTDVRLDKGAEPDCSFSFGAGVRPDLAVEVEVTRSALDKLKIYAALGIPEFWRFDLRRLRIYRLQGVDYQEVERSACLPFDAESLSVQLARGQSAPNWLAALRDWVRDSIPPRA
ncbi:Uma2 family endonuclease [bacterium CPR1]|nr:Uma2 family endonuclease [bacterium CPR1]